MTTLGWCDGSKVPPTVPRVLPVDRACRAFRSAQRGLLLLDYDGTLVPIAAHPSAAVPPPRVISLLRTLAGSPHHELVVVSGRPQRELDVWLGGVEGLWLAAEHGALLTDGSSGGWRPILGPLPQEWKATVRPVLERYRSQAPGSFVEEKAYSLVWHFRSTPPAVAASVGALVQATLAAEPAARGLLVEPGKMCLEVRIPAVTKAAIVDAMERFNGTPDFALAIGDDTTDEDMFRGLPGHAWTVHVGDGQSAARYRLPDPAAVNDFLERLLH